MTKATEKIEKAKQRVNQALARAQALAEVMGPKSIFAWQSDQLDALELIYPVYYAEATSIQRELESAIRVLAGALLAKGIEDLGDDFPTIPQNLFDSTAIEDQLTEQLQTLFGHAIQAFLRRRIRAKE